MDPSESGIYIAIECFMNGKTSVPQVCRFINAISPHIGYARVLHDDGSQIALVGLATIVGPFPTEAAAMKELAICQL